MQQPPIYVDLDHGISAIDTEYVRPLMDASHLVVDAGRAAFVDTGTTLSVPNLLATLADKAIAVEQVDYVFLTHVHLDHAGGAGALMQTLPNATAVLHPRGAPHLIEPDKLIAGTKLVYGEAEFAKLYGEIPPIPAARVKTVEDGERLTLGERTLEFIHTPGHAMHHYCIVDHEHGGVFSGDTFGVSYRETDTANGEFIFPTTTPTHFDPDALHASFDRIASYAPRFVYLTHYSRVTNSPQLLQDLHRRLDEYVAIAERHAAATDRVAAIAAELGGYLFAQLEAHGYTGGRDAGTAVLGGDVKLNAQGLDVWLTRLAKQRAKEINE